MNRKGGVRFDHEIFEYGVWEWGIEKEQSVSCYDYV